MQEEEILQEKLRWLKEVKRLSEEGMHLHNHRYLMTFRDNIIPREYRNMVDIPKEQLEDHIRRIEQDLEDLQNGEFQR
jgi:hypothetical protein